DLAEQRRRLAERGARGYLAASPAGLVQVLAVAQPATHGGGREGCERREGEVAATDRLQGGPQRGPGPPEIGLGGLPGLGRVEVGVDLLGRVERLLERRAQFDLLEQFGLGGEVAVDGGENRPVTLVEFARF